MRLWCMWKWHSARWLHKQHRISASRLSKGLFHRWLDAWCIFHSVSSVVQLSGLKKANLFFSCIWDSMHSMVHFFFKITCHWTLVSNFADYSSLHNRLMLSIFLLCLQPEQYHLNNSAYGPFGQGLPHAHSNHSTVGLNKYTSLKAVGKSVTLTHTMWVWLRAARRPLERRERWWLCGSCHLDDGLSATGQTSWS